MSKLAGSSNRFSTVEQNMFHISNDDVSPKFCAQNLHAKKEYIIHYIPVRLMRSTCLR